jgi:purine nucleosidase
VERILIDCDPGIDDALALMLAFADSSADVVGITTVAGNRPLEVVTRNALQLVEFIGAAGVPVAAGADRPLVREPITAVSHGDSGLGGFDLPEPSTTTVDEHAVDFIIRTVLASAPGELTIVAIGPLTNLALALRKEPSIAQRVKRVAIMGGGAGVGNQSPVAEFNFFADPEAASEVLLADWETVVFGLNLTWQSSASADVLARILAVGTPRADALAAWLRFYGLKESTPDGSGPSVHDACTIAWVLDPTVADVVPAHIDVETTGRLTSGESVVDLELVDGRIANSRWATTLDRERFWDRVIDALS